MEERRLFVTADRAAQEETIVRRRIADAAQEETIETRVQRTIVIVKMDLDTASILAGVMWRISGRPTGPRGAMDGIAGALERADVPRGTSARYFDVCSGEDAIRLADEW